MPIDRALAALGDERYVSLTTFRRSGEGVPTPVWIARDGDALIVTTPSASGKVKRLRNDPRVELRPCSRFGNVKDGTPAQAGVAAIVQEESGPAQPAARIRSKYGLEYRAITFIERVRGPKASSRVILRITNA